MTFTLEQKGEMIDKAVKNAAAAMRRQYPAGYDVDIPFWLAVGREYTAMTYASVEAAMKESEQQS